MSRYINGDQFIARLEELIMNANLAQRQDDVTESYKNIRKGMVSAYNHCINMLRDAPNTEDYVHSCNLNENVIYVSRALYERIKNNPNEIIIEAQCRPPIILKTVGVKKND